MTLEPASLTRTASFSQDGHLYFESPFPSASHSTSPNLSPVEPSPISTSPPKLCLMLPHGTEIVSCLPSDLKSGMMQKTLTSVEQLANRVFGEARKKDSTLRAFLRSLQFADLHNHIDGAIYHEAYTRFAKEQDLWCYYDSTELQYVFFRRSEYAAAGEGASSSSGPELVALPEGSMPVRELLKSSALRDRFVKIVSVGETDSEITQKRFFAAFRTLESIGSYMPLKTKLESILEDCATQTNIPYVELAIWFKRNPLPDAYLIKFNELFSDPSYKLTEGHCEHLYTLLQDWIQTYVSSASQELDSCCEVTNSQLVKKGFNRSNLFDINNPVVMRFIIDHDRIMPELSEFFAAFAAGLTLEQQDPRIVGNGLAGPENNDNAISNFKRQLRIIIQLRKRFPGSNLTMHAGELTRGLATTAQIDTCILQTMKTGAERIGHAACFFNSSNYLALVEKVKDQGTLIEVCLSSNLATLNIPLPEHVYREFISYGIPFCLGTDDPGILRSTLLDEYMSAIKSAPEIDYLLLKTISVLSLHKSFLPGRSIVKIIYPPKGPVQYKIKKLFRQTVLEMQSLTEEQHSFLESSDKAKLLYKMLINIQNFEQNIVPNFKV